MVGMAGEGHPMFSSGRGGPVDYIMHQRKRGYAFIDDRTVRVSQFGLQVGARMGCLHDLGSMLNC